MPVTRVHLQYDNRATEVDDHLLREALRKIRDEFELPTSYPDEALHDAERAVSAVRPPNVDWQHLNFITIDPPGAQDLDQALHISRVAGGYRILYAIADVPAFVTPGGALDAQTHERGQTIYLPGNRVPLHPAIISENAASLLPGQTRPAFVWIFDLDSDGAVTDTDMVRALIRSTSQQTYEEVQHRIDNGTATELDLLLVEVGQLRELREIERGGASLGIPDHDVIFRDGKFSIVRRSGLNVETYNAHISLMTGMEAAKIMLAERVGILRTMPAANQRDIARLRRQAQALDVPWPQDHTYGDFLRSLNSSQPRHLAMMYESASLFRGAGYTSFNGEVPDQTVQAAVAAPYTHVTAPLRRLIDRYTLTICESLIRGVQPPEWALDQLDALPATMRRSDQRARGVDRAVVDAAEAVVLQQRIGERFTGVVVDDARSEGNGKKGRDALVQIIDPPVLAACSGEPPLGSVINTTLVHADPLTRSVQFSYQKR